MLVCGVLCRLTEVYVGLWSAMKAYGDLREAMKIHGMLCRDMETYEVLW